MRSNLIMVVCFVCLSAQAADRPAPPKFIMPDDQFRQAIETEFKTTAPYYVLVHIVNDKTKETWAACVEPSQLLRAIQMEHNFPQENAGIAKAKELSLNQADRTFHFSSQEAFKVASPRYTEKMLAEVRDNVKEMKTEDVIKQIMDQSSPLYKFCDKGGGTLPRYLDSVAHILIERGLACGRSCKPGLIFVEKQKAEPVAPPDKK